MSIQIKDTISPGLARSIRGTNNPRAVLEAMGTQVVSLTKRAFSDAALRPSPWKPRKDRKPHSLLRKSGSLWQSIRITAITGKDVTVGSDRPYAAVHQFGSAKSSGRGSGIPARPFFPFLKSGQMTETAREKVMSIVAAKVASILRGGS